MPEGINKKLHEFYVICKSMSIDEFSNLLKNGVSIEEKEFYVNLMEFFMQKKQKKIIQ